MSILGNDLLLGSGDEGYNLTRSLRTRSSASAYLSRTPASASNRQTFTISTWVKRGRIGVTSYFFAADNGSNGSSIYFTSADQLQFYDYVSGSYQFQLATTQTFRDPSAWYHILFVSDTTQATASNRIKMYVNGVQVTAFSTSTYPSQNYNNSSINNANIHYIGYLASSFDGYTAETYLIDGQALTPSSFGETDTTTGVWKPKRYAGTYGTNGFYLPFTDNSALTTSSNAGLGKDFSGNGNYWTTNNISITSGTTYDSMTDVPTLTSATASNFCVGNPLSIGPNASLSNGNLSGTLTGSGGWAGSIEGLTSGKWYYEATNTASTGNSRWVGFLSDVYTKNDNAWSYSTQTALYANDARNGNNASYGATWTTGDVIGVALDLSTSNGSVTFYKNGVSQGVMFSSLTSSARWRPLISGGGTGTTMVMNFGQQPFAYTPPTGYVALNTYNLPTSTIVNGAKEMGILLYTGDGTTSKDVTGLSFQPDLTYVKNRSAASDPTFSDTLRGITKVLYTDSASGESTAPSFGYINSILSTGFNVNSGGGTEANFNKSGQNYVGWTWKAGQGSSSSNTSGSITSTVSVNASAGLSMVTYTGTGANATVGHGLGVAPSLIICKSRGASTNWGVWHASLTSYSYFLLLNSTAAQATAANTLQALPTSTLVSLGASSIFNDASTMVMYAWTPIAGYSAFGSYTGNGSSDGTFVYTGFRPRWILWKSAGTVQDWFVLDTARDTYNLSSLRLCPDLSVAEASNSAAYTDLLSNGFKFRTSDNATNASGVTYIYMAFAENPFKNSLAR